MKAVKKVENDNIEKYTKKQIVDSKMFAKNRDLLIVLLSENEKYSKQEIDEKIKNYKKGLVK